MSRMVKSKKTPTRFSILPAILGHEVIDSDGRAVAVELSKRDARDAAERLNSIAMNGSRAVAAALTCMNETPNLRRPALELPEGKLKGST